MKVSTVRTLEFIMGITVLLVLSVVTVVVIKDNQQFRKDSHFMDEKLTMLLSSNDDLVEKLFEATEESGFSPGEYVRKRKFTVSIVDGYLEEEGACPRFVIENPTDSFAQSMNQSTGSTVSVSISLADLPEDMKQRLENSTSLKSATVVLAHKTPTDGESCGASADILAVNL